MEMIVLFIAGLIAGIVAAYLVMNSRLRAVMERMKGDDNRQEALLNRQSADIQHLETEKDGFLSDLGRLSGQYGITSSQLSSTTLELTTCRQEMLQAREQLVASQSQVELFAGKMDFQKQELQRMASTLHSEFRVLADTILEEKSRKFTELNEEKLKGILDPLRNHLSDFKIKVEETYDKESKQRFALEKELSRLMELNQQLGREASNLTNALKQNNKVLGNWGEMILESLLENSGLARDREYFVQEFLRDETGTVVRDECGRMLQPDVTVMYPDGRRLIIDSKVSLLAFEQYNSCEDQAIGAGLMKDHCGSLRAHIDNLAKKEYPRYAGAAFDLVLLFIPLETAYFLALREEPGLWKYAFDRKVLLTTSTHLLAILRIVGEFWKVDLQNRNALEIAEKAGALYDKFAGFVEVMEMLGQSIDKTGQHFELAKKRLSEGSGNLLRRSEELKRMGAKTTKNIPWKSNE